MGYPPHNVAKHFRWISLPLYRWVSDRMFTFPPAMERWHETVPHTQVSHFLIIPHLCFYMNSKMTPGGFSLNGEMNSMANFNDEKSPAVLNFFWHVKWSVSVLYGERSMGFSRLKRGQVLSNQLFASWQYWCMLFINIICFCCHQGFLCFFNLYYTILIK